MVHKYVVMISGDNLKKAQADALLNDIGTSLTKKEQDKVELKILAYEVKNKPVIVKGDLELK